jgi:ATP-dependent helicase/nuclease subunit B
MYRLGLRNASDIELNAMIDEALERAVRSGKLQKPFERLAGGLGFRDAVRDAVGMLRVAGLSPDDARARAPRTRDVALVLEQYERLLETQRLADPARVFRIALAQFERESAWTLAPVIALAPDLRLAGLPGKLLTRLAASGARALPGEDVEGLERPWEVAGETWPGSAEPSVLGRVHEAPPDGDGTAAAAARPRNDGGPAHVDMFRAATPSDEVREVLRRIAAEGRRYEDVELVAIDRDTYGLALECIAAPLGISVTSLHGVPLPRTRLGRAIARWLAWLEEGLPADILREALEAGELLAPDTDDDAMAPVRLLRELAIGWGRARWDAALLQLRGDGIIGRLRRHDDETDADFASRREARRAAAASLAGLLERLLPLVPPVPERGSHETATIAIADLAAATLRFLELVPRAGHGEENAFRRLRTRLDDLARLAKETLPFGAAAAALRDVVTEVRAWPSQPGENTPRTSDAGALHLTDLIHAGTTGRPRVFVLGLDADRTSGAGATDPILDEEIRRQLASPALPTTAQRIAQQRWTLARALASLRGHVTLSCATSGDLSGRVLGPSPVLLRVHRLLANDPVADYVALRAALGAPAGAIPSTKVAPIDGRDAWLGALHDGKVLRDGTTVVCAAHPGLDRGRAAHEARNGTDIGAQHGMVRAAAGHFDPRNTRRAISPSSLEELAKCPLAWFYRRALGLRLPEEPVYDAAAWLDSRQRGSLLHTVFERFAAEHLHCQELLGTPAVREALERIVREELDAWRAKVPPPSDSVFDSESDEIRTAARAFLAMEKERRRQTGARWHVPELEFAAAQFALSGGRTIAIHGRIDRVDVEPDGSYLIIDFKTGSSKVHRKQPKQGPFNGGRSLQAPLYAAAAAAELGGTVSAFEYRFPTVKGESAVVRYEQADLAVAGAVVEELLGHVVQGHFLPTLDKDDCRFCDCKPVCRVSEDDAERVTDSPRAAWAKRNAPGIAEYAAMLRRRGKA